MTDGAAPVWQPAPQRRRPVAATALTLLAVVAVACGQLAWTANALLRDEARFAAVAHGTLVREPVRSEMAPDLADDLSEILIDVLTEDGGPAPGPATRRELHAVAVEVVSGPAFDAQLDPLVEAMAAYAVSGRQAELPPAAATVLWDAYVDRITQTHPGVAPRLLALPTPEELRDHLQRTAQETAPQTEGTAGLRDTLRLLPWLILVAYLVAFAAAAGAVHLSRGSGRVVAVAVVLPALTTMLVWTASLGPGSWRFLVHTAAQAALPACAVTAAVAVAALLIGSRRSMAVTLEQPPGVPLGG